MLAGRAARSAAPSGKGASSGLWRIGLALRKQLVGLGSRRPIGSPKALASPRDAEYEAARH